MKNKAYIPTRKDFEEIYRNANWIYYKDLRIIIYTLTILITIGCLIYKIFN